MLGSLFQNIGVIKVKFVLVTCLFYSTFSHDIVFSLVIIESHWLCQISKDITNAGKYLQRFNVTMDILAELYQRSLLDIIEALVCYVGYEGVCAMFQVSQSWRHILLSLGSWPRFVDVLLKKNAHLKHLCQLNGWDQYVPSLGQRDDEESTKECESIFQGLTDLARKVRSYNNYLSESER